MKIKPEERTTILVSKDIRESIHQLANAWGMKFYATVEKLVADAGRREINKKRRILKQHENDSILIDRITKHLKRKRSKKK